VANKKVRGSTNRTQQKAEQNAAERHKLRNRIIGIVIGLVIISLALATVVAQSVSRTPAPVSTTQVSSSPAGTITGDGIAVITPGATST